MLPFPRKALRRDNAPKSQADLNPVLVCTLGSPYSAGRDRPPGRFDSPISPTTDPKEIRPSRNPKVCLLSVGLFSARSPRSEET